MPDDSLVSVIIPTVDRPNTLERALRSVEHQSYPNLEVVIVNGGKHDLVEKVIAEQPDDLEISHLHNDSPQGLPAARNQGADIAEGEYLAFLDDDDAWHPEKIERQISTLQAADDATQLSYCGRVSITPERTVRHIRQPNQKADLFEDLLVDNVIGTPSGVLVSTSSFEQVGGFDASMHYQEDWEFYLRLSREYQWSCLSDALTIRFIHSGAMSRDTSESKRYRERVLDRYEDDLMEQGLYERAWATHYRTVGLNYCRTGNMGEARQSFQRAFTHQPTAATLGLILITLTGKRGFDAIRAVKKSAEVGWNKLTRSGTMDADQWIHSFTNETS